MLNPEELFAARVPRYTSYPTAPHFHAGVDGAAYRQWLAELQRNTPLSLYVHIPFCDTLCWFCGCHTKVVNRYAPVEGYLGYLFREIRLAADALGVDRPVTHIHWGGGSPTMLKPDDIRRLGDTLRSNFSVAKTEEFAIEIDPRGFKPEMAEALAAVGVTRASVGVQDCDPVVQRAINRIQTDAETAGTVDLLRGHGIGSLNIDLIYGLPHQTAAGLERTMEFACSLDPDRFAVFGYAHVPHFAKHQALIPQSALPGLKERFEQAQSATSFLGKRGYVPVGLDHFAKPADPLALAQRTGNLSRNFQGYTTDNAPALVGFGVSAIGALPQGYAQNTTGISDYRAAIDGGTLPVARGIALNNEDRLRAHIIERLMCDLHVDLGAACAKFGVSRDVLSVSVDALEDLRRNGVVTVDSSRITINPEWRAACRLACATFDSYLDTGAKRHAFAI